MIVKLESNSWDAAPTTNIQQKILADIERGDVIFLPHLKFDLWPFEKKFLTADCADPKSKNISLDMQTSILRGSQCENFEFVQLQEMMTRFAHQARKLIESFFPFYQESLRWGRTSFRPMAIEGRKVASYRKDDTRIHVDSFASRPVQGLRLLRVFSNIHPLHPRIWKLGEPFENVAARFLPQIRHKQWINPRILQKLGITKGIRSLYDHFMLQIHDTMKGDIAYQQTISAQEFSFPSGSSWIVMTDKVSHAALSGQFILEQTFYLPVEAMQQPDQAPLRILEKMAGKSLVSNK